VVTPSIASKACRPGHRWSADSLHLTYGCTCSIQPSKGFAGHRFNRGKYCFNAGPHTLWKLDCHVRFCLPSFTCSDRPAHFIETAAVPGSLGHTYPEHLDYPLLCFCCE